MNNGTEQLLRLLATIKIHGKIRTITGLHIGGNDTGLSIGGVDSVVIRNGLDGKPYIPGSTLKGKMRCLLERIYTPGKLYEVGNSRVFKLDTLETYKDPEKGFIFHLFGITPHEVEALDEKAQAMPTRLIFRDAPLSAESVEKLESSLYLDIPYTQVKTEVVIDRITSSATPRQIERVPADVYFDYEIIFNVYKESDLRWLKYLTEGMDLLEHDYIGGMGSRGYGQIHFETRVVTLYTYGPEGKKLSLETNADFIQWKNSFERPSEKGA
jgi:CRISPR-associated protein Csm3